MLTGRRTPYMTKPGSTERVSIDDLTVPGTYEIAHDSGSPPGLFHDDAYEIKIRWDQWVEVEITCDHGTYTGISRFFHVTEALTAAVMAFNDVDHPDRQEPKKVEIAHSMTEMPGERD